VSSDHSNQERDPFGRVPEPYLPEPASDDPGQPLPAENHGEGAGPSWDTQPQSGPLPETDAPDTSTTPRDFSTNAPDLNVLSASEWSAPPATDLWPSETGGTSERAIVTDATGPLMVRRLSVWRDEILAWLRTLISAGVYAILIVTFGFQVARVEGQSMAPTLADQDRLVVNKVVYQFGPPRRGDIVMLYYPPDPDKSFVKRIIAEEGDSVKLVGGRVYVNDVPINDDYVPQNYRSHEDFERTVVKEGYYFVMGDHRNNSSDSRNWGEVPKRYITGKVQLRWWPIRNARIF
jgi:signal peptidase I